MWHDDICDGSGSFDALPSGSVFLVRHAMRLDLLSNRAAKAWLKTVEGKDHFDPPLSESGKKQSRISAESLRAKFKMDAPFDIIFCSPLLRAVQTVEPFSEVFGVPIQTVPGLAECCVAFNQHDSLAASRWSKLKTVEELRNLCPRATFIDADPVQERFIAVVPSGQRHATCLGRLLHGKSRILACSHRESIRTIASDICKLPGKQETPYACIALFLCSSAWTSKETWVYKGLVEAGFDRRYGKPLQLPPGAPCRPQRSPVVPSAPSRPQRSPAAPSRPQQPPDSPQQALAASTKTILILGSIACAWLCFPLAGAFAVFVRRKFQHDQVGRNEALLDRASDQV